MTLIKIPKKVIFVNYVENYLQTYKLDHVTSSTYVWYLNLNKYLNEYFEGYKIQDIEIDDVQQFLNSLSMESDGHKALSKKTIKGVRSLLSQVLEHAYEEKIIDMNPARSKSINVIDKDKKQVKRVRAINSETCNIIFSVIEKSPVYKAIIYTLIYTGLRIGELLALRWDDIDFDKRLITISRAVYTDYELEDYQTVVNRDFKIGAPKSDSGNRLIPMSDELIQILNEWKAHIEDTKWLKRNIDKNNKGNLVFPNKYGKLRARDGLQKQFLRFLNKECETTYGITFHRFRHTFATLLVRKGVNLKAIQEIMGHADMKILLEIYADVNKEDLEPAATAIDEAVESIKEGK